MSSFLGGVNFNIFGCTSTQQPSDVQQLQQETLRSDVKHKKIKLT